MRCIICDKCREVIKNPRFVRTITCARPLKVQTDGNVAVGTCYRGNDRQQNDIFWEKEVCDKCANELELWFDGGNTKPDAPDIPVEGGESSEEGGDGSNEQTA